MHGPRLVAMDEQGEDDDQRPDDERAGSGYDLRYILGPRAASRLVGRRASWMNNNVPGAARGGRALPPGGGYTPPPGAPRDGEFATSRDLAARREAYYGAEGAAETDIEGGLKSPWNKWPPIGLPNDPARDEPVPERTIRPPRPVIPGERKFRDGDRVRHPAFGEGTVVTSKLTRDDEEVTVAFPERGVKKLLASLANMDILD